VAHHLDRLVEDGLIMVEYRRLTAKRGPGAGRPSKLYRRAEDDFGVSLPPRRYDLAGRLLADAVDRSRVEGTPIDEALEAAARSEGQQIGAAARDGLGRRTSTAARQAGVLEALRSRGFDPETGRDGVTVLHNCPFHLLAQEHTELICGMNLCLLEGLLDEVENTRLQARLEPEEGFCCVRLHRR
jgi:predicted ArsR family transcriptional regulator